MATTKLTIPDNVRDILQRATIEGRALQLPGQLTRAEYDAVMRIISAAGGKWDRKSGTHLFPSPVKELFEEALRAKEIVHRQNAFQSFYTPPAVAEKLLSYVNVSDVSVLEPSAGGGELVAAALRNGALDVTAYDIDPMAVATLRERFEFAKVQIIEHDFLRVQPAPVYGAAVMNPPFANGQDIQHVRWAHQCLAPGGTLVAIVSPTLFHSAATQRLVRDFQQWFALRGGERLELLPEGTFKESGTNIATQIIRLRAYDVPTT